MTIHKRQPQTGRRTPADAHPEGSERDRPPGQRFAEGSFALGISFLGELDQPADSPVPDEWQRYVEDRLRHYSISHR
jgi:hypothetical protein